MQTNLKQMTVSDANMTKKKHFKRLSVLLTYLQLIFPGGELNVALPKANECLELK